MKRRLVFRLEARIDIKDATRWYEREQPGLGRQLVAELDRLFERILQNPGQFPKVDQEIHRALLHQFPYELYFRLTQESVRVLAVVHQRRHPDIWRLRAGVD
jgi:plasmid stabilization system protein ParE